MSGEREIRQLHFAGFSTYVKKFLWYGKGDGEFCRKHPERMPSMIFHLLVSVSVPALLEGHLRPANFVRFHFFVLQGVCRFTGLSRQLLQTSHLRNPFSPGMTRTAVVLPGFHRQGYLLAQRLQCP